MRLDTLLRDWDRAIAMNAGVNPSCITSVAKMKGRNMRRRISFPLGGLARPMKSESQHRRGISTRVWLLLLTATVGLVSGCSSVHKVNGQKVWIGRGASSAGSDVVGECPRWEWSGGKFLAAEEYAIEVGVAKVDGRFVATDTIFTPQPELLYLTKGPHTILLNLRIGRYPEGGVGDGFYGVLVFDGVTGHRYKIKATAPRLASTSSSARSYQYELWLEDCATNERVGAFSAETRQQSAY